MTTGVSEMASVFVYHMTHPIDYYAVFSTKEKLMQYLQTMRDSLAKYAPKDGKPLDVKSAFKELRLDPAYVEISPDIADWDVFAD
jgi:hypothetical protein